MARYDLTARAAADLREIVRYTHSTWGVHQARRYRQQLDLALQKLSLTPEIGRTREEVAPKVRSFLIGEHIVFYVQRRGGITILRVLHPSMEIVSMPTQS